MMFLFDVAYHIDGRGRTAGTDFPRHVLNLIELMLFTNPGERVNRPDFGGGARTLVFDCNSDELVAALRFNVQANLQRWLADRVDLRDLAVENQGATLRIHVQYS